MKQARTWLHRIPLALTGVLAGTLIAVGCGNPPAPVTPAGEPTAPAAEAPAPKVPAAETPAVETPAAEAPAAETPAPKVPAAETPAAEAPAPATEEPATTVKTPAVETPAVETPAVETPAVETPAAEAPTATPAPGTPPKIEAIVTFKEAPKAPSAELLAKLAKRFKVPVCVVHYTATAPVLDGSLNDKCWEGVAPVTTQFLNGDEGALKFKTEIRSLHDGTYMYLSFVAHDTNMDSLLDASTTHDNPDWNADYVQFFVRPDHKTAENKYAGIAVFPGGGLTDHMGRLPEADFDTHAEAKVKKSKTDWTTEIKIPLTDVGAVPGHLNAVWRGNFFRVRIADGDNDAEDQGWSATGEVTTHVHEKLGVLYFEGGQDLKDDGE